MRAAVHLAELLEMGTAEDRARMFGMIHAYGPIPPTDGLSAENLLALLAHDKKTVQGVVHFILPVRIGEVKVVSGAGEAVVLRAIRLALQ
jgi:3-dehydroquinate synthase